MKKFFLPLFFAVLLLVPFPAGAAYVNNGDGTVTDNVTGLLWQRADDGVMRTWEEALDYCETRTLAGRRDWRLPNIRELKSIVDRLYDPAIDPAFECRSDVYWSGSTIAGSPHCAWGVRFDSGYNSWYSKDGSMYVRCVCAGPSGPFDPSVSLVSGWNLISFSLFPSDPAIEDVLTPITGFYTTVWSYQDGQWLMYDPLHPLFNNLNTIQTGYGYWINMTKADTLTVAGTIPSQSVNLKKGWNLVGFNGPEPISAKTALGSVTELETVWSYQKNDWLMYDPTKSDSSGLKDLTPGYGYWIKVKNDCTWTLP